MSRGEPRRDTTTWGEYGGSYSADGRYRWSYEHAIGDGAATICWIGLHPATGDSAGRRRPTLQRMVDRSLDLGFGRILLVNLFSWRCDDFIALSAAAASGEDVVGAETDDRIAGAVDRSDRAVAAWGGKGNLLDRGRLVAERFGPFECLGTTVSGQPRQPLYVPATVEPIPFIP